MPFVTIDEQFLEEGINQLSGFEVLQIYNGLDFTMTDQICEVLRGYFEPQHITTYERTLRVQALCFLMQTEGMPIDRDELFTMVSFLESEVEKLQGIWRKYCAAIGAENPINAQSPDQLKHLFYTVLRVPEVRKYDPVKKVTRVTVDAKALEERIALYPVAAPFVACILAIRQRTKMISVFKRGIEKDARLRCSFHPAGTETGRLASSQNVFGRGTNAQNITPKLRKVVAAEPGWKIAVVDLEQAESRAVAYLSGDPNYIAACEGGDLHTTVCQMVWKQLPWTGVLKQDKAIAEQPFYRHYSFRDMAKRGGHGTNYYGQAPTIAKHMKVDQGLIFAFQSSYFAEFPGIKEWHKQTILTLQRERRLMTPMQRERCFWGRPDDSATHREGIAFVPQSLVADVMNEGLCQTARYLKDYSIPCYILAQIHDAGMFYYREQDEDWLLPELNQRVLFPVEVTGLDGQTRLLKIPLEWKVGWNWGYAGKDNPGGLTKWKPGRKEDRIRPKISRMEKLLSAPL